MQKNDGYTLVSLKDGSVLPLEAVTHPVLARILKKRASRSLPGREYGLSPGKFNFGTHQEHQEHSQGPEHGDKYNDNEYNESKDRC